MTALLKDSEKAFISPLEHLKSIEKNSKSKIRPQKLSGLQPNHTVIQPSKMCCRKLKNDFFSIYQNIHVRASQGLHFL